jgi:hypothetical protein
VSLFSRSKFVEIRTGPAERHDTYRLGNVSGHVGNPSDQSSGYHQGELRVPNLIVAFRSLLYTDSMAIS